MKKTRRTTKRQAERLANKLLKLGRNGHALKALERLQARADLIIGMPMADVLDKITEQSTVAGRARLLGITRQAYYDWLHERTRPNPTQAAKLAELTGLSVKEIRGKE